MISMEEIDKKIYSYPIMQKIEIEGIKHKRYPVGYIKELDLINIKEGYIGDVVQFTDEQSSATIKIALPKRLKDEYLMFSEFDKEKQKWMREAQPTLRTQAQIDKYKQKIVNRRVEGVWITINGEEIYLTGHNYFFLQFYTDQNTFMDFRFGDLIFFYFLQAVIVDKRALGILLMKSRRQGATAKIISTILNIATIYKNKHIGLMSKTSEDVKHLYKFRLVDSFRNIPPMFQPMLKSKDILTKMEFSEPIKKNDKGFIEKSRGLNNLIDYRATSISAFDSVKLSFGLLDEVSKMADVAFDELLGRISTTLRIGSSIVGTLFCTSTFDVVGAEGFIKVWDASDMKERDLNGQTKSGLYRFYIPTDYVFSGYIDEYGYPIIETPDEEVLNDIGEYVDTGFEDYHNNKVEILKETPAMLYEFFHQFSRTVNQAFMATDSESIIDLARANDQIYYIESQDTKPYKTGEFVWRDPSPDRTDFTVDFIPTQDGSFRVYWMPPKELRNNHILKNGKIYPANDSIIEFSTDPYKVSKTTDSRNSNTALVGMMYPNVDERMPDGFSVAVVYNKRERTVEEMLDKMIRVTLFYSAQNLVEKNVDNLINEFYNRGLTQFVRRRPDKKKLTSEEKRLGGIPNNSENILQLQALYISDYGTKYIGKDHETEEMKKFCMDKEVISELIKYNPRDRTDSDLGIVMGLVLVSIYARLGKLKRQEHTHPTKVLKEYKFSKRRYSY